MVNKKETHKTKTNLEKPSENVVRTSALSLTMDFVQGTWRSGNQWWNQWPGNSFWPWQWPVRRSGGRSGGKTRESSHPIFFKQTVHSYQMLPPVIWALKYWSILISSQNQSYTPCSAQKLDPQCLMFLSLLALVIFPLAPGDRQKQPPHYFQETLPKLVGVKTYWTAPEQLRLNGYQLRASTTTIGSLNDHGGFEKASNTRQQ